MVCEGWLPGKAASGRLLECDVSLAIFLQSGFCGLFCLLVFFLLF